MKTVDVPLKELPMLEKWRGWVDVRYLGHENQGREKFFKMDAHPKDGGHFVMGRDGLPRLVIISQKCYDLDAMPVTYGKQNQDASDLPLYEEIFDFAHMKKEKDDETCKVIRAIDFLLVAPLLENILNNQENEALVRELRGRVLRAEFNAVTIWREGKSRKE